MSKEVGIICKLKTLLPKKILLKLPYALVHPLLLYGLLVWGSTYPSYIKKLIPCNTKLSNIQGEENTATELHHSTQNSIS